MAPQMAAAPATQPAPDRDRAGTPVTIGTDARPSDNPNGDTRLAMPPLAPLAMPEQSFRRPLRDPRAPGRRDVGSVWLYRLFTFGTAAVTTAAVTATFVDFFDVNGLSGFEWGLLAVVTLTFFWIAFSVGQATLGLFFTSEREAEPEPEALDVALLFPVYNEAADAVFGNIRAMRRRLASQRTAHRISIFVLSDTRDDRAASREEMAFALLRAETSPVPVHYRRRARNTARKVGNIHDWVTNWGGGYDAMVTMDADSILSGRAVVQLADRLGADPAAALIQTVPNLVGSRSLFGRLQQFANNVYGPLLALGLRHWAGTASNYWGHNAIIRTSAFAACCGLPELPRRGLGGSALGGPIKSHDFVEAALLVRAGWGVRLATDITETFEEVPQAVPDYVLRDRRWAQGNLQHLRLVFARGLHPASRFHMAQGAMAYVASFGWLLLLVLWLAQGAAERGVALSYFDPDNPLFPVWPQMDTVSKVLVLGFVLAMLLGPKVAALAVNVVRNLLDRSRGDSHLSTPRLLLSGVVEIVMSAVLAPVMMVQHVIAVVRTLTGFDTGWAPQNRGDATLPWTTLLRFHAVETVFGVALTVGIAAGFVTPWLLPVAVPLLFAVPVSWLTGRPMEELGLPGWLLATPQEVAPPTVLEEADRSRRFMAAALAMPEPRPTPRWVPMTVSDTAVPAHG